MRFLLLLGLVLFPPLETFWKYSSFWPNLYSSDHIPSPSTRRKLTPLSRFERSERLKNNNAILLITHLNHMRFWVGIPIKNRKSIWKREKMKRNRGQNWLTCRSLSHISEDFLNFLPPPLTLFTPFSCASSASTTPIERGQEYFSALCQHPCTPLNF